MYTLRVTGVAAEQDHGVFRMDASRFLEYTDEAIVAQLMSTSAEAVERLRTWPCILMEEGRSDEKVRLGRITDASRSRREISLTFEPLWLRTPLPLTNDDIWKLRDALDIGDFTGKGELPGVVIQTWGAVWQYFEEQTRDKRAYTVDFERFDQREPSRRDLHSGEVRSSELANWRLRVGLNHRSEVLVNRRTKLSPSMTLRQFDNGYWYATQLKDFGKAIGIPSAGKLRKDELEKAIRSFLVTGKARNPTRRNLSTSGIKDVERGLSLELDVVRFTNDKETKSFLEREAQTRVPGLTRKSGVRYRFNRWREEQLAEGVKLTYRDLVEEYVRLNQTKGRFAQIPYVCYINFLSDFLAAEKGATREQAIRAWKKLKSWDAPKTYRAWTHVRSSKSK